MGIFLDFYQKHPVVCFLFLFTGSLNYHGNNNTELSKMQVSNGNPVCIYVKCDWWRIERFLLSPFDTFVITVVHLVE